MSRTLADRINGILRGWAGSPLAADVAELRDERDAWRAIATGPTCDACDCETATNVTPDGFYGCDGHRSPGSVDLPYAEALRAIPREERP